MRGYRAKVALSLAVVIAVAGLIFFFSAQDGADSSALSGTITRFLLKLIHPGFDRMSAAEQLAYINAWALRIRKAAHFLEFALLGMATVNFLRLALRRRGIGLPAALAWAASTLYAGTDELHQLFVSDRAGMLTDIAIDSAGALVGVVIGLLLLRAIHCLGKRRSDDRLTPA